MNEQSIRTLAQTVQMNCHISDARHGADDSLCVYLMKMREYFRWEMKLPLGAALGKDQVGGWLQERERMWQELEDAELLAIDIDGESFDPFDSDGINDRLEPHGLVYSGGLGNKAKPHFFLGDLEQRTHCGDHDVFVVANEHARDLTAPPAMTLHHSIFLRRESLRRMLWEKLESWRWAQPDNALGRAFACYDFEHGLERSLDTMTDREIETLLLHEEGEYRAGLLLGDSWGPMLLDLINTPSELVARSVRDHLADCTVTLPTLIERAAESGAEASIHFFLGNLTSMRRHIFPGLVAAYQEWLATGDTTPLSDISALGKAHWERLAFAMMDLYGEESARAGHGIKELVEANRL